MNDAPQTSLSRDEQCHILLHGLTSVLSGVSGLRRFIRQSTPPGSERFAQRVLDGLEELDGLVQDQVFAAETVLAGMYPDYYRTLDYAGNRPTLVDLYLLAVEVCEGYSERAAKRCIDIEYEVEPKASGLKLLVSESMVRRAIHHVMSNALKYSYHGDHDRRRLIAVQFRSHDSADTQWVLSVENYGVGIDPDEIPNLVKPGFRSRQAIAEGRTGAGLGLSDVNAIMKLHGGRVLVSSLGPSGVGSDSTERAPFLTTVRLVFPTLSVFHRRHAQIGTQDQAPK